MKENQEKRIEKEMMVLYEAQIQAEVKVISKREFIVEILIEGDKVSAELDNDIYFLIHVSQNYPHRPPKIYCLTQFSIPSLADGKDLLEDIMNSSWDPSTMVITIIQKIPTFLTEFINGIKEGKLSLVGNYYLGEKYEMNIFERLPGVFKKIKQKLVLNNKEKIIERYLFASDLYICLFDRDYLTLKSACLTLIFWANIRAIISIQKNHEKNQVRLVFKDNYKLPNYEILFQIEPWSESLISNLLKIMKTIGIDYNLNKSNPLEKQENKKIDVIENVVKDVEIQEQHPNILIDANETKKLIFLYQKAIEYFRDGDENKYKLYSEKLQRLLNHGSEPKINSEQVKEQTNEESIDNRLTSINPNLNNELNSNLSVVDENEEVNDDVYDDKK